MLFSPEIIFFAIYIHLNIECNKYFSFREVHAAFENVITRFFQTIYIYSSQTCQKGSIQPDKYQSGKNSISVNTKVNTQIWVWDTNKKATKSGCIHISEKLDAVTRKIQTFVTTVGQKIEKSPGKKTREIK